MDIHEHHLVSQQKVQEVEELSTGGGRGPFKNSS